LVFLALACSVRECNAVVILINPIRRFPIATFVVGNLGASILLYVGIESRGLMWGGIPYWVAGFSPGILAVLITGHTEGWPAVWRMVSRFGVWRVNPFWYFVSSLLFVTLVALTYGVVILATDRHLDIDPNGPRPRFFSGFRWILYAGWMLASIAIGEELGWRGFLLRRLERRWSPLVSSLAVGAVWTVWHGHWFALLSPGEMTLFAVNTVGLAVIIAWLMHETRWSLLIATLAHVAANMADLVPPMLGIRIPDDLLPRVVYASLLWAFVGVLIWKRAWQRD